METKGEDEEFKVGDRVVAVSKGPNFDEDRVVVGHEYTLLDIPTHADDLLDLGRNFDRFHGKEYFKKVSTNQPRTTKKEKIIFDDLTDIQREKMCGICVDLLETDRSRCEGSHCKAAFELYLEEINLNQSEEDMNKIIKDVFEEESSKVAQVINDEYGDEVSNTFGASPKLGAMFVEANKVEMIGHAKKVIADAKREAEKAAKEADK